ncbi:thiol reductant ABC exporter subunit CydD [Pigmentiphaga litoralis]|nr:thiol reductant ABC exporter subunit CydD [Pigmentiphaga litoralis]
MENPGLSTRNVGSVISALAALVWIPQAGLIAAAVHTVALGGGAQAVALHALGFFCLGALRSSLDAWAARRLYRDARACVSALRAQAAGALAARSPLDISRPASGLAASVIGEQAETLVPWLTRYAPARWRVMLVPPVIVAAVGVLSWTAALILMAAAPLVPIFMALIGWRAKAASEAQLVELGRMNALLLDRLRGLTTLRALRAVPMTAQRLRDHAESLRARTMHVLRIAFLSSAVLELFAALGIALTAVYIGFHLLGELTFGAWGDTLTLAEGLFILLLAPAFFEPLRDLSAAWHDRAAGEAARDAIAQLIDAGKGLVGPPDAGTSVLDTVPSASGAVASSAPLIALHGLRADRHGGASALHFADLDIEAGQHVALWGSSGSGKTLLLSLMAGLIKAQSGTVNIGGAVLNDQTAATLRQRMAWMGQKPHVFAGSVATNVSLGHPDVSRAHVEQALQAVGLTDALPHGGSRSLGEGGLGLSGGEVIRLAMARVAARPGADILLVDEPTAHLDNDTARRVIAALQQMAAGRTLVVATHDPRLAQCMDRIVDIDAEALA